MIERLLLTCLRPLKRSCWYATYLAMSRRLFTTKIHHFPRSLCTVHPSFARLRYENLIQRRCCATATESETRVRDEAPVVRSPRRRDVIEMVMSVETGSSGLDALRCLHDARDVRAEERVSLAEDVVKLLRERGETVTASHHAALFRCYAESDLAGRLERLRDGMKRDGVSETREVQELVLRELSERGEIDECVRMVKELESDGGDSDNVIGSLIYGYAVSGDVDKALKLWEDVMGQGSGAGSSVMTSVLRVLAMSEHTDKFVTVWNDSAIQDFQLSNDKLMSVLQTIHKTGHVSLISKMMADERQQHVLICLCDYITKLLYNDDVESAHNLMMELMMQLECGQVTEMCLIGTELCKSYISDLSHVLNSSPKEIVKKCRELRQLAAVSEYALEHALHHYLKSSNVIASLIILQAMYEDGLALRPHYFWPLIIVADKTFGFEGVVDIVRRMERFGVELDHETLKHVIFPRLPTAKSSHALKRLKIGLEFHFVQEAYVVYALRSGHFDECRKILESDPLPKGVDYGFMEEACIAALTQYPVTKTSVWIVKETAALDVGSLIRFLIKQGYVTLLKSLLPVLLEAGIGFKTGDSVRTVRDTANLPRDVADVIARLAALPMNAQQMKESAYQLRRTIEDAEIGLFELESKGMNTISQRLRLIRWYMQAGMFAQAVREKNNVVALLNARPNVTPGMAVIFARLAAAEDNIQDVLHYHGVVSEKGLKYDIPKGVAIALCMMKHGKLNETLYIANNFNVRHEDVTQVEDKIVEFLRSVAELDSPKTTQTILLILVKRGVVKITGKTVAVLAEHHLQKGNLDAAVEKYSQIVNEFNIVPSVERAIEAAVGANRFDLVDKLLEMTGNDAKARGLVVVAAAAKGDPQLVTTYAQKYGVDLNLKTIRHLGYWDFTADALRALVLSAPDRSTAEEFIGLALTNFRKSGTYDGVCDFCREMRAAGVSPDVGQRPSWRSLVQLMKFKNEVDDGMKTERTTMI